LQPLLARHAGDINRRRPDEVIDALTQAGLFRMLTPRRFGGYAVAPRTVVEVSETLAMTDASAGWAHANVAWAAAHGTEQMQLARAHRRVGESCAGGSATRVAFGRWPTC